jgi:guanyl-specific ribonuclease Sa
MQYNKKTLIISVLLSSIVLFFVGRWSKEYTIVKTDEIENNKIEVSKEVYVTPQDEVLIEEEKPIYIKEENVVIEESNDYSNENSSKNYQNKKNQSINIPDYALETLKYIRKHKKAPENYVGGRHFQNRERQLPQGEKYQEWDVHPKVQGKNRGAERLVTSETKAYFTNDHYRSFTEIKE